MSKNTDEILETVQAIVSEYDTKLTLRQIFYQLVTKHIFDNTINNYKRLSRILVKARHNGDIDWDDMKDRTRQITGGDIAEDTPESHFDSAKHYIENCWKYFKLPRWLNQEKYVEVWFEKQALEGIFEKATASHAVVQLACKGYSSHDVGYRLKERIESLEGEREAHLIYFGDWDPSGIDIYRFIQDMATMFELDIKFERIAITQEQIEQYEIPPMMAKSSDSRFAKFAAEYGTDVVELDALKPDILIDLIKQSVQQHFDQDEFKNTVHQQLKGENQIKQMLKAYIGNAER